MSTISRAVRHVLRGISDRQVVVGPSTWRPSDGLSPKIWYFIVATCDRRGFRCDQIAAAGDSSIEDVRRDFIAELARQRRPIVAHLCDDELYMARLCDALWPGERIARLVASIEAERNIARPEDVHRVEGAA